jgi:acetolactate synthase-1/3 small subunit
MKLVAPFGILESTRTGKLPYYVYTIVFFDTSVGLTALPRTPLGAASDGLEIKDAGDVVDASTLPPG